MTSADHEFANYDAAYLLGALPPEERQSYERHLQQCDACTASVRELAGMPGLLSTVDPLDAAATEEVPVPPSLLPTTLARAQRERRRSRRLLVTVTSTAACLLIALGTVVAVNAVSTDQPNGIAMAAVAPTPMHATAALQDVAWGTKINLQCSYDYEAAETHPNVSYTLAVTDRGGNTQLVGSWRITPGRISTVSASTALARSDISELRVLAPNGNPVLALRP